MSEDVEERKVQDLIFEFPWLLDINYEKIHELYNEGYEHTIDNTRIDLLCRHKLNGKPVIIEFKKGGFYRENIGQILEYRTRVMLELKNDYSNIQNIFGNKLSSPVLCLVVKECGEDARIACNFNGIEVYEYKNYSNRLLDLERTTLDELGHKYKNELFVSPTRHELVNDFYNKLRNKLEQEKLIDASGWKNFKQQNCGEYWYSYQHMFINKWLFSDNETSIGIYENIWEKDKPRFAFGLYSSNEDDILQTIEKWKKVYPEIKFEEKILSIEEERYAEIYLSEVDEEGAIVQYINLIKQYMYIYI